MTSKILVTGASGFIGERLCKELLSRGRAVLGVTRNQRSVIEGVEYVGLPSVAEISSLPFHASDCVIHLAGRAHVQDKGAQALSRFREINSDLAVRVASAALASGVRRFIFVSSIGVNGGSTSLSAIDESSLPAPHADYALSKLEAELALQKLIQDSHMELVIVRPPLVYAGNAPGNFARLLKVVQSGVPLPFASVVNQRSMIALENIVDFLVLCIDHPKAAGELFLVSDGDDVSISEIIKTIAFGMGVPARLFRFPPSCMHSIARLARREALYNQLCASLVIDSRKSRELLGWVPVVTVRDALAKAGLDYRQLISS